MTVVRSIQSAQLERDLAHLMERIKTAEDRETRVRLWGQYQRLHRTRSAEQVERMERQRGLLNA